MNEKNVINYHVTIVGQSAGIDQHCGECTHALYIAHLVWFEHVCYI